MSLTTYRTNDQVHFAEIDGEGVLMDTANGLYYGLDEVGTAVWGLLNEGLSPEAIVRELLERYEASEAVLSEDIRRLLADLHQEGLIRST